MDGVDYGRTIYFFILPTGQILNLRSTVYTTLYRIVIK